MFSSVIDVSKGSWLLRENADIEFANGNFVSTSIDLKNRSACDSCRGKTIEKNNSARFSCARVFTQPGSNSEVRARKWADRFTVKNRHHQPGLSAPKSAMNGHGRLFDHLVGTGKE